MARTYPGRNVGIVCGNVVAVDIDVLDPDLAHRIDALALARLGEAPLRIGLWPKRLRVYRPSVLLSKMMVGVKGAAVELLGAGQQFAAFGIHPDTRRPYKWPDGDLRNSAIEDLPEITPEAARAFMAEAATLLPHREDAPARARAAPQGGAGGDAGIIWDRDTGRVVDGRDAFLSTLAFHAVHDALERGERLDLDRLTSLAWDRFQDAADLTSGRKGTDRAWGAADARVKVRDKLRLHAAGQLPARARRDTMAPEIEPSEWALAEAQQETARTVHGFIDRACARHALPAEDQGEPEHGAVAVDLGVGKTHAAVAELPAFIRRSGRRVAYLVAEHKLSAEVADRIAAHGVVAAIWRGREATNPATGLPMCSNLDAVRDALDIGADVEKSVCGSAEGPQCPTFKTCAYQGQKAPAAAAQVLVAAHDALFRPPAAMKGAGIVIADEAWWQAGVRDGMPLRLDDLRAPLASPVLFGGDPERVDTEGSANLGSLTLRLAGAVENAAPYLTRAALDAAGLTADNCAQGHKLEWARKVDARLHPDMTAEERRAARERAAWNAAIPRRAALWDAARELLESDQEATGRIEVETRQTREGTERMVILNLRRAVHESIAALPILALDATLPETLLQHFLPRLEVQARIRARAPHMTIHQVTGGWGKTSLVPDPEAGEAENARREARIAELRDFIRLRSGGAPALVATYLGIEDRFADLPGVRVEHFGRLRGIDTHKHAAAAFIIGRPLPSPREVRRMAAAVTGKPVPEETPQRRRRGALMANGAGAGIEVRSFTDPDAEAVRAAVTDAEVWQAVGRVRGVRRTGVNPVQVYVLADALLPVPLADMARWDDVKPGLIERMAARGVVITSATDARHFYPDLLPTDPEAAKKAMQRAGGGLGDNHLWRLPIGECPLNRPSLVPVTYRPSGRGQQTRTAWAAPARLPSLRAELEAILGPLAHYLAPVPPALSCASTEASKSYPSRHIDRGEWMEAGKVFSKTEATFLSGATAYGSSGHSTIRNASYRHSLADIFVWEVATSASDPP
jgi:hypothetical protein